MRLQSFATYFAVLQPILLAGCSGGPTSSAVAPEPDGGVDDATPTSGEDSDSGSDPRASGPDEAKEACEALIACVADVDPASAGALVTLYGDASNCWKGGESDAEACGKACAKSLEARTECTTEPLDRRYLTLCTASLVSGTPMRFDVVLAFDPRKGGEATFRPLPIDADVYRSGDALMSQPKLLIAIESGGGAGETNKAFDLPSAAFDPYGGAAPMRVSKFSVSRLRIDDGNVCSDIAATTVSPHEMTMTGACIYLPLAEGAPIPTPTPWQIANCQP